jgi:hypothetical protein
MKIKKFIFKIFKEKKTSLLFKKKAPKIEIIIDFERALMYSFQHHFPLSSIITCMFH